jgi:NAD(P)-dependent dehydrogenase (short-subunit alcohol dehydrogenase family)
LVSYTSIKAFINTFTSSLRLLAVPYGVDVMCVQPGFIDTQMLQWMRKQGSVPGQIFLGGAEELVVRMKDDVEESGQGIVMWLENLGKFL